MASKLRVFAEDFPSPTAVVVEWQEAGIVLFVDVCRSTFEVAPPSVWLMQPAAAATENLVTTLSVSPSSVSFRCSSFVPCIVGNVLILAIGDAYAKPSSMPPSHGSGSSSSHHHPSPPFFGVCASLLPPPNFVRDHGVDAFASFAFAWLCGPDAHSMRPQSRIGFACCVTQPSPPLLPSSLENQQQHQQQNNNMTPNASLWVHGGVPYVPKHSRIPGADPFEPLGIGPELDAESDVFIVNNPNAGGNDDRHLRKAVSEDFYSLFELKLSVVSDAVSVWPWTRRSGLPLLCHHSLTGAAAAGGGGGDASPSPSPPPPAVVDSSSPTAAAADAASSVARRGSKPFFLIAFGGLRLTQWRCIRPDLLPQKNTEFTVSNTFYVYDVAADSWEWRDTLAGTALAQTDVVEGGFPIVGPRPPPVFEHKVVCATSGPPVLALSSTEQQQNEAAANSLSSSSSPQRLTSYNETTFVISGGLRGRFSERSKELWCFSPQFPTSS